MPEHVPARRLGPGSPIRGLLARVGLVSSRRGGVLRQHADRYQRFGSSCPHFIGVRISRVPKPLALRRRYADESLCAAPVAGLMPWSSTGTPVGYELSVAEAPRAGALLDVE